MKRCSCKIKNPPKKRTVGSAVYNGSHLTKIKDCPVHGRDSIVRESKTKE